MLSNLEKSVLCCTLLHVLYTETAFSSQKQPKVPKIQSEEIRFFSNILEDFCFFKLPASVSKKGDREYLAVLQLY